jgi:hypothetical protein
MLSLREAFPEKQSDQRGVATWAITLVNERVTKANKTKREGNEGDMVKGDEG